MLQSERDTFSAPPRVPISLIEAIRAQQQAQMKALSIVDERQDTIRANSRVAPGNSAQTLLSQCGYQVKDGVYTDFLGKNVLDIGGGFGGIAPRLAQFASQITIVDPMFRDSNLTSLYNEDKEKAMHRIGLLKKYLKENPHLLHIHDDIAESNKAYEEIAWWKDYEPNGKHRNIKRNPSFGENLVGVTSNMQDIVFVNYVLLKDTVRPREFLEEVKRVLKPGGCLILSDYRYNTVEWTKKFNEAFDILRSIFPFDDSNIVLNEGERCIVKVYKQ